MKKISVNLLLFNLLILKAYFYKIIFDMYSIFENFILKLLKFSLYS